MPAHSLPRRVAQTLRRNRMLRRGDVLLVAVSGGPDSTALLAVLKELSESLHFKLYAAHYNHRLRGEEADRDEATATALCVGLDVKLVVGRARGTAPGANIEAAARVARYAFLHKAAKRLRCSKIATGHTLDDQAETVLMRVLRGSGADGLRGIAPVRDDGVIRPLLGCRRSDIIEYLSHKQLSFAEDSSNLDLRFLRNRLRRQVLPLLATINPRVFERLATLAQVARSEAYCLDSYVQQVMGTFVDAQGGLDVKQLQRCPDPIRLQAIRHWLRHERGTLNRLTARHLNSLLLLVEGGRPNREVHLPGGGSVIREYDRMRYAAAPVPAEALPRTPLRIDGPIFVGRGWRIRARLRKSMPAPRAADPYVCLADAELVDAPLLVRSAQPGDRIQPFGMAGHRKLQDVFVDRRIPRDLRWTYPVLEVDGAILWIPGLLRSATALVSTKTRRVIEITAQPPK